MEEINITDQERRVASAVRFRCAMYTWSLGSWFMRTLKSTPRMKVGSVNESQVQRNLPAFFDRNTVSGISSAPTMHYSVRYLCTIGLIGSKSVRIFAGSPDGISAMQNDISDVNIWSV